MTFQAGENEHGLDIGSGSKLNNYVPKNEEKIFFQNVWSTIGCR